MAEEEPSGEAPEESYIEEDIITEGEPKIDLPYFSQAQKVLAGEPIINTALFQINEKEQRALFETGETNNPRFQIRDLMTPEKFGERMKFLDHLEGDLAAENNIALRSLYLAKVQEMRYQLQMRLAAGKDPKSLYEASLWLYGAPTEEEFRLALEEREAKRSGQEDEEKETEGVKLYSAQELCEVFNRAIEELGIKRWEAILTTAAAITVDQKYPGGPKVKIPAEKKSVTLEKLEELLQHEIVTHLGRGRSGQLSRLALIGFMSADRYAATEEGLATYAEQEAAIRRAREPKIAGVNGVIAIGAAMGLDGREPRNFRETYEYLRGIGCSKRLAWNQTRRVFRGITDPSKRDGNICTLDWVYRKGNLEVVQFVATRGEPELDRLWVGKVGIHHLGILSELGITQPAVPRRFLKIEDLLPKGN